MSAKILLADCVSAYRNVVANQLRGLGAEVVETEDGTETIEVMKKLSFDVAIIDNYLVERSSVDLLPVIRFRAGKIRGWPGEVPGCGAGFF